jgi:hypothetical protein
MVHEAGKDFGFDTFVVVPATNRTDHTYPFLECHFSLTDYIDVGVHHCFQLLQDN